MNKYEPNQTSNGRRPRATSVAQKVTNSQNHSRAASNVLASNRQEQIIQNKLQDTADRTVLGDAGHAQVVQREKNVLIEKDLEVEVGKPKSPSPLKEAMEDEELGGFDFSMAETLDEYLDEKGYSKGKKFRSWDGKKHPKTGWKFHVSAKLEDALDVAMEISPLLKMYETTHKFDVSETWAKEQKKGDTQVGKYITIYPADDEHTAQLADLLNRKLKKLGLAGIKVPGEYKVGDTSMLYMRHGQLSAVTFKEYAKKEVTVKDGPVKATDLTIDVEMDGYDSLYCHEGVLYFMKGKAPAPAMDLGTKLKADPRQGANPAGAPLPKGLTF